jgi:hypothetical protein
MVRGWKERIIKARNLILKGELCFELKEIVRAVIFWLNFKKFLSCLYYILSLSEI